MNAESKPLRHLLVSPWPLLVFLVIPASVILSVALHIRLPLASYRPLLLNNALFACVVAARLAYGLVRLRRPLRYPADMGRPGKGQVVSSSPDDCRARLAAGGFAFDEGGRYGEKRDAGYVGTLLLYAGILMVLATGVWDSLRQFSGTLLDGVGMPTKLNEVEIYRVLKKGPLTPPPAQLPRLQVTRQILPDTANPDGATEILLLPENGQSRSTVLRPGERFTYRDYEIYMSRLLYEPVIMVRTRDGGETVFNGAVRLDLLGQNAGPFSFYGTSTIDRMKVEVYYQPQQSRLWVVIHNRGKRILDTGMRFQVDRQVTQGGLVLSCEKLGQWSEIQVVRMRHMGLMAFWGILAAVGALMRLGIPAQRVWLEEEGAGCRVRAVGGEAERLLGRPA
jgi:hypothetical protein